MNECSACRLDFASVDAFDRHRMGRFPQSGPADYFHRVSLGLEEGGDWKPARGRRCLGEDELETVGLEVDDRGRWRVAAAAARVIAYRQKASSQGGISILRAA